jgi:hypothetical protein
VTFVIGPSWDTLLCNVSPLDCVNLLLVLPYQQDQYVSCHNKYHQYHLQHEGNTYVLTSSTLKSTQPITEKESLNQVSMNQCISLCLVFPINPHNQKNLVPLSMAPLLQELADVFTQLMRLPPFQSMEHTLDLILGAYFPNTPSYHIAPRGVVEIECSLVKF